jgi:poly(3-hydroxybutyrate) depolymerase
LDVTRGYNVDKRRIYASGFGNGCSMAIRLAMEADDLIAATACMSGVALVLPKADYRPVPHLSFIGPQDVHGPWVEWSAVADELKRGSPGKIEDMGKDTKARILMKDCAETEIQNWARWNGCDSAVEELEERRVHTKYHRACSNGAQVGVVKVEKGGHRLYKGADTSVDTTRLAWDFLSGFSNQLGPDAVAQIPEPNTGASR